MSTKARKFANPPGKRKKKLICFVSKVNCKTDANMSDDELELKNDDSDTNTELPLCPNLFHFHMKFDKNLIF